MKVNRYIKRTLTGVFTAAALYWAFSPGAADFDETRTYEPNAVQAEFLRLAAHKYHYLALGDTDHRRVQVRMFALNSNIVKTFSAAGKKNYFLENGPQRQDYFDALQNNTPWTSSFRYADGNMWLCRQDAKDRMNDTFESSARDSGGIRFIAADQRMVEDHPFNKAFQEHWMSFTMPLAIYQTVYGCIGTPAFVIPGIAAAFNPSLREALSHTIIDDTRTAQGMLQYSEPAVILYGSGHFDPKNDKSMRVFLKDSGRSFGFVEIRNRAPQGDAAREYADKEAAKDGADAILYVVPSQQNPDGISVYNDEMKALYERAKENARSAKPAALFPNS